MDQAYSTAGEVKKNTQLTRGLTRPGAQITEKIRNRKPVMNGWERSQ
jgi:hypothetical protein